MNAIIRLLGLAIGWLSVSTALAQTNDEPCTAQVLAANTSCIYTTATNASATASANIPVPSCGLTAATRNDVWFRVTLTQPADLRIRTRALTMNDGVLQVLAATDCQTGLREIGCNDDGNGVDLMPDLQLRNLAAGTYYLRMGSIGTPGAFDICVQATPPLTSNFVFCDSTLVQGAGTTVTYTGTASTTANYYWSFDDGTATPGTGLGPQRVVWNTAGTKTITLTVEQNGITSATASRRIRVVAIAENPSASFPGSTQTVCTGQLVDVPILLSGRSPWSVTYTERTTAGTQTKTQTFGLGGECNPTLYSLTTTASASTTLTVTRISDANYRNITQNVSTSVAVGTGTLPVVTLTASPSTVLVGQSVTLTNTQNAGSTAVFLWDFSGGVAQPGTGSGQQTVIWASTGTKVARLRVQQGVCVSTPVAVSVVVNSPLSLTNDEHCNALDWPVSSTCSFLNTTNVGATPTGFAATPSVCLQNEPNPADSWYKFTLPQVSDLIIGSQGGSLTDGVMELYAENPCPGGQGLQPIACDDNSIGQMPLLNVAGQRAGTYWVRFWGRNRQTGTFGLCVQARPAVVPTAMFSINSLSVCASDTARFNIISTGVGPWTVYYDRTINGVTTQDSIRTGSGLAPSPYIYPIKQVNTATTRYRITGVRDANYSRQVANSLLDLFITPLPSLTITTNATSASVGQLISLSYTGNADTQAVFSWSLNGGTVVSGTGRGPLSVRWDLPGTKRVQLTISQNGCQVVSSSLVITITGNSPIDEPCLATQVTAYTGACPTNLPRFSLAGATSNTVVYGTCWSSSQRDVWVKFTIANPQPVYINVLGSTVSDDDSQLLSATSCTGSFTQIACNGSGGPSSHYFSSLAAGTYYFRTFDYSGTTNGDFSLCVAGVSITTPPATVVTNARLLSSETTVCRGTSVTVPLSVSGSGSVQLTYDEISQSGPTVSRTVVISNATTSGVAASLTVVANQTTVLILRDIRPVSSTLTGPLSATYTINTFSTPVVQVSLAASTTVVPALGSITIQPVGTIDLFNGDLLTWDFSQGNATPGTGIGPHTVSWNTTGLKTVSVAVNRGNCPTVTATRQIRVQPANDEICNATPIIVSPVVCRALVQYNLSGATSSTQSLPTCGYSTTGQGDVWFQFTISGTQSVGITTSAGSIADVAMQVFTANSCQSSLSLVNCTDYNYYISPSNTMPEARLANLRPGTYYVRIIGQSGLEGTFGLCAYILPPPTARFAINSFSNCTGTSVAMPLVLSGNGTMQLNYAEISNGIRTNRQVSIGSGVTAYTLLVAPTSQTTYRLVSISDAVFSSSIALLDSAVVEPAGSTPTATFLASSSIVTTGQAVTLSYAGTGLSADQYRWDFDGANVLNGTGRGPYVVQWLNPANRTVRLSVARNQFCSSTTLTQAVSVTGLHLYDQVCDAITLPVQATFCSEPSIQYSTAGATSGTYIGCSSYSTDVWFKFSLPSSASISITTRMGTLQYPQIQVLGGPSCTSLSQLQCTPYTSITLVQPPVLNLAAGTYYIRVSGYYNNTFGICVNQIRPPAVAFATPDIYACVGQPATIPISLSGVGPWRVSYDELNGSSRISRQVLFGTNQTVSPAVYALSVPVSNTTLTRVVLTALSDSIYLQRPVSSTLTINPITSLQTAFILSSLTALTGGTVIAQLAGTAVSGALYTWDFEDGTPNTATDPTNKLIFWRAPGIKSVTLQADKPGCPSEVTSKTIVITGSNLLDNPCQAVMLSPVSQTAPFTLYSTQGSTTATTAIPPPSCFSEEPVNDVWFSFSLATASDVTLETQARTLEGSFIQLLSASACTATMQELRCSIADPSVGDEGLVSPILRYNSLPAGRYWVRLGAVEVGLSGVRLLIQTPQLPTAFFTDADATICGSGTQSIGLTLTGKGPWSLTYINNGQATVNTFGSVSSYGPLQVAFISTLTSGINQYFLRAVSDVNFPIAQSSPDTLRIQVASILSGLQATNITTTSAILSWSGTINGTYDVQWRLQGATNWLSSDIITENSLSLSDLVPGGTYEWRVRVSCPDASTVNFATATFLLTCPTSPTVLYTFGITSTGAYIGWNGIDGQNYMVRYRRTGTTSWIESSTLISTPVYNITGLTGGNQYEWQVRVVCSGGGSTSYSASAIFLTQCYTPGYALATSITDQTAYLYWTQGETGTQYQVQYRPQGSSTWVTINGLIEGRVIVSNLLPNTTYEWQVRTLCTDGQSSGFAPGQVFTTSPPCPAMFTVKNGLWSDPTVWSCNRVPVSTDLVALNHAITIPDNFSGNALRIMYGSGAKLLYGLGGRLRLGP